MAPLSVLPMAVVLAALATSAYADISGCPGVLTIPSEGVTNCCVGGAAPSPPPVSVCDGWPICKGPVTVHPSFTSVSCITQIPLSASNYLELASAASASLSANGGTATTGASAGSSSSGPAETGAAQSSSSGNPSSSADGSINMKANVGAGMAAAAGAVLGAAILL